MRSLVFDIAAASVLFLLVMGTLIALIVHFIKEDREEFASKGR